MVIAVLDGEGEGCGRGAAEQGAGAHEKSVGSARPVIECERTLSAVSATTQLGGSRRPRVPKGEV